MTDLEALSKPTELQFINPLALKRGQRVPAGNLFSNSDAFVTFPFRASTSERKIGVEGKPPCRALAKRKEKKKNWQARPAQTVRIRYLRYLGTSRTFNMLHKGKKKVQTGRIACHLSATSDTP